MNISSAPRLRVAAVALVAVLGLAVSVGGASATTTSVRSAAHGTASVAYAGSLELWAATNLGPKFEAATGDGFQGRAAGSGTLASEILANEIGRQEEHQEALAGEEVEIRHPARNRPARGGVRPA